MAIDTPSVITSPNKEAAYETGRTIGRCDRMAGVIYNPLWYSWDSAPAEFQQGYERGWLDQQDREELIAELANGPATDDEALFEWELEAMGL